MTVDDIIEKISAIQSELVWMDENGSSETSSHYDSISEMLCDYIELLKRMRVVG